MSEITSWIRLLIELGLEVYKAATAGQDQKTVGEILADRGSDLEYLSSKAAAARDWFASQGD